MTLYELRQKIQERELENGNAGYLPRAREDNWLKKEMDKEIRIHESRLAQLKEEAGRSKILHRSGIDELVLLLGKKED